MTPENWNDLIEGLLIAAAFTAFIGILFTRYLTGE